MSTNGEFAPTVLVADDDPATLRLIGKIVSDAGYPVVHAQDGREAFDRVLAECPDLIISDWEMPGMTGPALCQAIRKARLPKYVYVVLLTARTTDAEMVEGLEAGADDFIVKPIKPAILRARLRAGTRVLATERRLLEFSQRDPLTGALNRRTFHERFEQEWERTGRYQHPLSCVMVDLDFFKKVNDTYGHAAGDAVLRATAGVLQEQCRAADVVCRYGGEEFCILLPETDETGAVTWSERTRQALAKSHVQVGGRVLGITGSLGVAQRLADTKSADALIDLADQALAIAKQSGRNRVVRYSSIKESDLCGSDSLRMPLRGVVARDVMLPVIVCPLEDESVEQVSDLLLDLRMTSAPVIGTDGRLAGVVSEIDLARATARGGGWKRPIRDIMKTEVVTFKEDAPAERVLEFLSRASIRHVVVVTEARPTGIISRGGVLRWLRNWSALHPELSNGEMTGLGEAANEDRRQQILRIIQTAEQRLAELRRRVMEEKGDRAVCLVGEATRLQEMVNDLLGHSSTGYDL